MSAGKSTDASFSTRPCIACGYLMPASGTLCSECSSYQSVCKNWLRYAANIAGIGALLLAVGTYVISSLPHLRRLLWWRESVTVLAFNPSSSAFANEGDGELFLSHISISYRVVGARGRWDGTYQSSILKSVPSGSIVTMNTEIGEHGEGNIGGIISGVSDTEWESLFLISVHDFQKGCVHRQFLATVDPKFIEWTNFLGSKLKTYPVTARLHNYSPHTGSKHFVEFPAVGVLGRSHAPECQPKK